MYSSAPVAAAAAAKAAEKPERERERDENGRFKAKSAGLLQDAKDALKRRKYERRVNKMFDTPQGGERRATPRRADDLPIVPIEPPSS